LDTALIVFTAGTAASFIPLYWLAIRLSTGWSRPARAVTTRAPELNGRREFLDLLRREAASRAVAALHEALVEARMAADHTDEGALSAETRRSLTETGHLVDSLLARELTEAFRHGAEALAIASSTTIGAASKAGTAAISAFERALDGEMVRLSKAPHRARWGGLLHRGRGLVGAGGLRAAA
jgi:hypothetical protein